MGPHYPYRIKPRWIYNDGEALGRLIVLVALLGLVMWAFWPHG